MPGPAVLACVPSRRALHDSLIRLVEDALPEPDTSALAQAARHPIVIALEKLISERTRQLADLNHELAERLAEAMLANRELNEAREQFRSIFDHAVEGMYQSSPAGWYLRVNSALARMYGYSSPRDMLNSISNIAEQVYVDRKAQHAFARLIREHGQVCGLEYRVKRKDGTEIWISEHARAIRDARGAVRYYEGTVQDITARKRAEEENAKLASQLQQHQKMEAIGTLAGGIAHDFNNMLNAILGYTDLSIGCASNPKQRDYLLQIQTAGQRAAGLVKQILAFSRQSLPEKRLIRLTEILSELTKSLRSSYPSIDITVQVEPVSEPVVQGDMVQFHQLFLNLATNAAYAMRKCGGTLSFHIKQTRFSSGEWSTLPAGDFVEVCVSDTGDGMPPEMLHRIFEPFFTTKPIGEGTGMGLAVVHGIVRSHGGDITVSSEPGAGTTFRVFMPIAPSVTKRHDEEIPQIEPGSERVLVVDDEEALTAMLHEMLSQLGYDVVSFTDSTEALRYIEANPDSIDLLITDQTMPQLTGLELVEQARKCRPGLPVVLCSGFGDQDLISRAHRAQVRFAPKPVSLRDLSVAMRSVLTLAV